MAKKAAQERSDAQQRALANNSNSSPQNPNRPRSAQPLSSVNSNTYTPDQYTASPNNYLHQMNSSPQSSLSQPAGRANPTDEAVPVWKGPITFALGETKKDVVIYCSALPMQVVNYEEM